MFGKWFKIKRNVADYSGPRLKAVLQQWHGIEPRSDFESCVWRRIRTAAVAESNAHGFWVILRGWLVAEPAWVHAMAATAGLLVGVAMALPAPQTRTGTYSAAPLLHSQTLAGAYLTMVSGGSR